MKKASILCKRYERLLNRLDQLVTDSFLDDPNPGKTVTLDVSILSVVSRFRHLKKLRSN